MNKKALIVWGGWWGHEPERVANRFAGWLRDGGFDVEISDTYMSFAKYEPLLDYDLIVPLWSYGPSKPQEAPMRDVFACNLADAVSEGVGIAGCHGGMADSFRENVTWQFLMGSQWVNHQGDKFHHNVRDYGPLPFNWQCCKHKVYVNSGASSPLVEGIPDFEVFTEQYYLHVDPANDVLAYTIVPPPNAIDGPHLANGQVRMPVVYTRRWGKGKIYYNALGHNNSVFDVPEAAELMRRGLFWAAR